MLLQDALDVYELNFPLACITTNDDYDDNDLKDLRLLTTPSFFRALRTNVPSL